jgi:phosphatidylglycerophosphate synthase
MFAFVLSIVVTIVPMAAALRYMKRRPVGTPLTWGEAMVAATFVFFVLFMAYGVVPHQWLTWADNELGWRPDRLLVGPGGILGTVLPFELTYLVLRDVVVSGIYGGFLAAQVVVWKVWQERGKAKPPRRKELETSPFGRPLVKLAEKG